MKKIAILGSTGVIGSKALEVVRDYPKDFKVISLACGHESEKFQKQIKEFKPKVAVVGSEKLVEAATEDQVDLVVVAVVGMAGIEPTLAAIRAGKNIALATKEVLVAAGEIIMREAAKHQTKVIPIDSEHSAIWQSLRAGREKEVRYLFLTMGKGRISEMNRKELDKVTPEAVFNRKTWQMGEKIAVDSATGMNKAFEIIEARWLFGIDSKRIKILVHPEYLCHSMVEFVDGSVIAEIGVPEMKRYVEYSLFYPERRKVKGIPKIALANKSLSFEPAPMDKFPILKLGYRAAEQGGTMTAVLHGADEASVERFLDKQIEFTQIAKIVEQVMKKHKVIKRPSLKQIFEAEKWAQEEGQKI